MPRDLSSLPKLTTLSDLVAFMAVAPADRVVQQSYDLSAEDWRRASGVSLIYVVASMRHAGAKSAQELRQIVAAAEAKIAEGRVIDTHPWELAVIGNRVDAGQWHIGDDLQRAFDNAKRGRESGPLARGHLEDIGTYVLLAHPDAIHASRIRQMRERVVITHPELGIYLGNFIGLGFWTLLDPAGQPSATTFIDEADARRHVASWDDNNDPTLYAYVPVEADPDGAVGIPALKQAGLGHLLGDMENDALRYAEPAGTS